MIVCQSAVLHFDMKGIIQRELLVDDVNAHAKCDDSVGLKSTSDQSRDSQTHFPGLHVRVFVVF